MIRPWQTWLVFGLCLAVVLGAMGWISARVLRLESAQIAAQRDAALEEDVRLALWRMDSALTPLVAQESMRPYFSYEPFYPSAFLTCDPPTSPQGGDLAPSPLLTQLPPHVLLHFQVDSDGKWTSPQVPVGQRRQLAVGVCTTSEKLDASAGCLAQLQSVVSWDRLFQACGHDRPAGIVPGLLVKRSDKQQAQALPRQSAAAQSELNLKQLEARTLSNEAVVQKWSGNYLPMGMPDGKEALMKPVWIDSALFLLRRVLQDGKERVQGCWLDWPAIRTELLESIAELLPNATLEPVRSESTEKGTRMLASFPVMVVPGAVHEEAAPTAAPLRISLLSAWGCVLLAAGAVAALLLGVMSLSERRAAFVSAVTHELRTPLTTFRMYSEMLSRGMVLDDDKRRRYLSTLCTEADRLTHLVGNVLAYARLEKRGPEDGRVDVLPLGDLLERSRERLARRAEEAGSSIELEVSPGDAAFRIRADAGAVEQIVFNLVDNACKYAAPASAQAIRISASANGGCAEVRVRDHGPGISRDCRGRLFRPFSKSASDAANSAPGVGLGLALSRRLARAMGGDLKLDASVRDGACFVLTLPAANQ